HPVLVLRDRSLDDLAAVAGVLHTERPFDVGGPVPGELLVERPRVLEHLAPERHQVSLDSVARPHARRRLELAEVGPDDPVRAAPRDGWVGEGSLERRDDVAGGLDRTVEGEDEPAARTPETGVARGRPPGPLAEADDLHVLAPAVGRFAGHVRDHELQAMPTD